MGRTATDTQPPSAGSHRRQRVRQAAILLIVSAGLLWAVIAIIPGVSASTDVSLLVATLVIACVSALLRPALGTLASPLGWVGVVLVGLFAQGLIFYAALAATPGIALSGFWPAFWAAWLYALLVGIVGWAFDANDDNLFLADVLNQARKRGATPSSEGPGVVILQIDGLPEPLLR